jgi:hypothetical protein
VPLEIIGKTASNFRGPRFGEHIAHTCTIADLTVRIVTPAIDSPTLTQDACVVCTATHLIGCRICIAYSYQKSERSISKPAYSHHYPQEETSH